MAVEGVMFESRALEGHRFVVREVEGHSALNGDYTFDVHVEVAGGPLPDEDRDRLLVEPARIVFVEGPLVLNTFSGVLLELTTERDLEHDVTQLHLRLVPRIALLGLRRGSEIFLDESIPDVIAAKLSAIGLKPDVDFVFSLRERYPRREIIVQYEETDLAFVRRLAESIGLVTLFKEGERGEVIVITDGADSFEPGARSTLPVRARTEHPAAFAVRTSLRRTPASAIVSDFNYRTPQVTLETDHAIVERAAHGVWAEHGAHVKTPERSDALATVRAQEIVAGSRTTTGIATEAALRAGACFQLVDEGGAVTRLVATHVGFRFRPAPAPAQDGESAGWENRFVAIPEGVVYRPPRTTPVPRVPGLVNAKIDGAVRGEYAELDALGRYHVRLAFDRSGRTDLGATHPVRMIQPHAGASYGMHFPLRPDTEVLVGFVNGDPDRPIIVGAVPNPATQSPVAIGNQTQNVLRTGASNELVLEDARGSERIRLHTPFRASTLQLGAPEEAEEGILLKTEANLTAASRRSNTTLTARQTTLADATATIAGSTATLIAGVDALREAALGPIEAQGSLHLAEVESDLRRLAQPPALRRGLAAVPDGVGADASHEPVLQSEVAMRAGASAESAARTLVRGASEAADLITDAAVGRRQGEGLGVPAEPAAVVASGCTASLMGRDVALVSGDRVAAISSDHTAILAARQHAGVKSTGEVEIAAKTRLCLTTPGVLDAAARTAQIVAGYYPEAEAPPLDDTTSLGIMARQDLRIHSVEDCILLCAGKNLVGSAHAGDVSLHASGAVRLRGDAIEAEGRQVSLQAEADLSIGAGGELTLDGSGGVKISGARITITAADIVLAGNVRIEGNAFVAGGRNW